MIRADQTHLPVVARTHPGMTGKNNEDRYAVTAYRLRTPRATPALLAVLSDGIGGHRAGEVAAEMAVNTISQQVSRSSGGDPTRILQQAVQEASQAIYRHALGDQTRKGMGATCAVAWIIGSRLYAATVGDSRLYLMRGSAIRQLSTDHTWVQEAVERGYLQPDQAKGHPNAHVIRRYLGSPTPPKVDIRMRLSSRESDTEAEANQGLVLQTGDRLLLCSDGLTDLVSNEEILSVFQTRPVNAAVDALIELANLRGGHDNITLIAIDVPTVRAPARTSWLRRIRSRSCVGGLATVLVLAGLAAGGWWYSQGGRLPPIFGGGNTPTPAAPTPPSASMPSPNPPTATTTAAVTPSSPPGTVPTPAGTALPTATPTSGFAFPPPGAATLTPWPTNTLSPGTAP
ncbi:MAG TPA: protein phosphatase 2C domain-containing protein [Anaerolineaceae bacterium]